ncbi:ferritin-like domain-containing protein [Pedobacter sp. Leaf176]|uniref:YciE/YciF ferroxidase family protein n=1 Tax=Pedobacter sp. Leaf176 TaxID=1736286 RepID=UPI0009E7D741|nr:ferritin-like domain-containing protein [Pedobacter sp. Leaf176]
MVNTKTADNDATKQVAEPNKKDRTDFIKFFTDELKDIYWAEKHLALALPKLQLAATSPELAAALERHAAETRFHIETLEQVFTLIGEKAVAKKCDAMEGLLNEADGVMANTDKGSMLRDAALILAAQKIEHYEIATYGTLIVFAEKIEIKGIAALLMITLENEKETDAALTAIAEASVNEAAFLEQDNQSNAADNSLFLKPSAKQMSQAGLK